MFCCVNVITCVCLFQCVTRSSSWWPADSWRLCFITPSQETRRTCWLHSVPWWRHRTRTETRQCSHKTNTNCKTCDEVYWFYRKCFSLVPSVGSISQSSTTSRRRWGVCLGLFLFWLERKCSTWGTTCTRYTTPRTSLLCLWLLLVTLFHVSLLQLESRSSQLLYFCLDVTT